jgi:hypothetical protein
MPGHSTSASRHVCAELKIRGNPWNFASLFGVRQRNRFDRLRIRQCPVKAGGLGETGAVLTALGCCPFVNNAHAGLFTLGLHRASLPACHVGPCCRLDHFLCRTAQHSKTMGRAGLDHCQRLRIFLFLLEKKMFGQFSGEHT